MEFRDIKNIDLHEVASRLGLERQGKGNYWSPFREEKNPSFSIYFNGYWKWKEHGTGETGSAIDLVMKVLGHDLKSAHQWFDMTFGGGKVNLAERIEENDKSAKKPELCGFIWNGCKSSYPDEVVNYLINVRKIARAYIEKNKGQCFGYNNFKPEIPEYGPAVAFPLLDSEGKLKAINMRYLADHHTPKMRTVGITDEVCFCPNLNDVKESEKVWLCESPIDAISLHSAGFPSLAYVSIDWGRKFPMSMVKNKTVIFWPDRDSGNKQAEKLASELAKLLYKNCTDLEIVENDTECKDANEVLQRYGYERLIEVANNHLSYEKPINLDGQQSLPPQSKLAELLVTRLKDLCFDDISENWMKWKGNYWQQVSKREATAYINLLIRNEVDTGYSTSFLNGVSTFIEIFTTKKKWNVTGILPFKNGLYRLEDKKLLPHSSHFAMTWQLPYDYDEKAICEPIQQWLASVVDNENEVQVLRAYLNAIINSRVDLQRYLELIGMAGTGKGTFIRLAEALVGEANCHPTELKQLENNRFETSKIYGKKLVVITDADNYAGDVSVLKAMTGQDTIRYEEKNKQTGQGFRSQAMVIIAANEPISSKDFTSGIARRRITVFFKKRVEVSSRRNLEVEFKPFIPGVINWVLGMSHEEVTRYLRNTDSAAPTLKTAQKENLIAINPMAAWLDDQIVYDKNAKTAIGRKEVTEGKISHYHDWLYPNYITFCEESGFKALAINRFTYLLLDLANGQLNLGITHIKERNGKFIVGLRIRTPDEDIPTVVDYAFTEKSLRKEKGNEDVERLTRLMCEFVVKKRHATLDDLVRHIEGIVMSNGDIHGEIHAKWLENYVVFFDAALQQLPKSGINATPDLTEFWID